MNERDEMILKGLWDRPVSAETAERVKQFWRSLYSEYNSMSAAFESLDLRSLYSEHGQELGVSWGVFRALGIDVSLAEFDDDGRRS